MDPVAFETIEIDEDPGTFHARSFDDVDQRTVWLPRLVSARTLVLGSSQSPATVDHDERNKQGIDLATRRSGGGAVLVSAADLVWFDVILPASDPLWVADVTHSFDWLGAAVKRGLASRGINTEQHGGALQQSEWSTRVCFAGLGPGELTLDGRKVVGISQRRTRRAARFQVAILRCWDPALHANLLAVDSADRARAAIELDATATGLAMDGDEILGAILPELSRQSP